MWTVSQIICLGSLTGMSVTDIYYRKVSAEILVMGAVGTLLYQILFRRENLWIIGGGIAVGAVFLLISRVTREKIGYGDSVAICILGAYMGVWELLKMLSAAFVLLFVAAILQLCKKRMSKKASLPLFPFLAGGYLLVLLA